MSELVKFFVFDLQRFADVLIKDIKTHVESVTSASTDNTYYWDGTNGSITTSNTSSGTSKVADTQFTTKTEVPLSTSGDSNKDFNISAKEITTISTIGVENITVNDGSANTAVLKFTAGAANAVTLSELTVSAITVAAGGALTIDDATTLTNLADAAITAAAISSGTNAPAVTVSVSTADTPITINTKEISTDAKFTYTAAITTTGSEAPATLAITLETGVTAATITSTGDATKITVPAGEYTIGEKTYTIVGDDNYFVGDGEGNVTGIALASGGSITSEDGFDSTFTITDQTATPVDLIPSTLTLPSAGSATISYDGTNVTMSGLDSSAAGDYTFVNITATIGETGAENAAITWAKSDGALKSFKFGGVGDAISASDGDLSSVTVTNSEGKSIAATFPGAATGANLKLEQTGEDQFTMTGLGTLTDNTTVAPGYKITAATDDTGLIYSTAGLTGFQFGGAGDAIETVSKYFSTEFALLDKDSNPILPSSGVTVPTSGVSKITAIDATTYSWTGAAINASKVFTDYTITQDNTNASGFVFNATDGVIGAVMKYGTSGTKIKGAFPADFKFYDTLNTEIDLSTVIDASKFDGSTEGTIQQTAASEFTLTGAALANVLKDYTVTTAGNAVATFSSGSTGKVTDFNFVDVGDAITGSSFADMTLSYNGTALGSTGFTKANIEDEVTITYTKKNTSFEITGKGLTSDKPIFTGYTITTAEGDAIATFKADNTSPVLQAFQFGKTAGDTLVANGNNLAGITLKDSAGTTLTALKDISATDPVTVTVIDDTTYSATGKGVTGTVGNFTLANSTEKAGITFNAADGLTGVILSASTGSSPKQDSIATTKGDLSTLKLYKADGTTAIELTAVKPSGAGTIACTEADTAFKWTATTAQAKTFAVNDDITVTNTSGNAAVLFTADELTGIVLSDGDVLTGSNFGDNFQLYKADGTSVITVPALGGMTDAVTITCTSASSGTYTLTGAGVTTEDLFSGVTITSTDSEKLPTVGFTVSGTTTTTTKVTNFTFGADGDSFTETLPDTTLPKFKNSAGKDITLPSKVKFAKNDEFTLTQLTGTTAATTSRYVLSGSKITGKNVYTGYEIGNTNGTAGLVFNTNGDVTGFAFGGEGDSIKGDLSSILKELYTYTAGEGEDATGTYTKLDKASDAIASAGITGTATIAQLADEEFLLSGDGTKAIKVDLKDLGVTANVTAADAGLLFNNTDGVSGFKFGEYVEGATDNVSGKLSAIKIYAPDGETELTSLIAEVEEGTFAQNADGYQLSDFTTGEEGIAIGEYTVTSTAGGAVVKFDDKGENVTGFTFGKVGDAIKGNLTKLTADVISYTDGSDTKTLSDLGVTLTLSGTETTIEQTDAGFAVSGLAAGDSVALGDYTVTATAAGENDSVTFTTDGKISAATIGAGGKFTFEGLTGQVVNINGEDVQITSDSYVYEVDSAEDGVEIIDLTEASGDELAIVKPGKATKILPPTGEDKKLTIGETPYTYTANGSDDTAAYFYVNGDGKVAYVFGAAGDAITIDGAEIDVYDGGIAADNKVVGPTVDKGVYTITKEETDGQYSVAIHDGSKVTIANTSIDFTLGDTTDPDEGEGGAKVVFDKDGKLVNVAPFEGDAFEDGDALAFNGALSSGVAIVSEDNIVAVADGSFIYGVSGATKYIGLGDDNETVTAVADATEVRTAAGGSFAILDSKFTVDDEDGVTFAIESDAVAGISALNGSVVGNFEEALKVNSVEVSVTGDEEVAVFGDNETVTKIAQLGGEAGAEITASGASVFGVDSLGAFTFGEFGSFGVSGANDTETEFDFTGETVAITGVDEGEILSGGFSTATSVNGKMIEIANDEDGVSLVGGTQILGLTGGASVVQAEDITSAKTDGAGKFTFAGGQSFTVSDDEVTFVLDGKGKVVGVNDLDGTITGNLNGLSINGGEKFDVTGASGPNTNLTYDTATKELTGVTDKDTVNSANGASSVWVGGADPFVVQFSNGSFSVAGDADGVEFLVTNKNVAVAINSLDSGASLTGAIGGLSINGKTVDITDENGFGVVGADEGISEIYNLSDGAIVTDAAGATLASTDEFGEFKFGEQSFTTAGDSAVAFVLDETGAVTGIQGLSAGSVVGSFSGITVNEQTINVVDSDGEVKVVADDAGKLTAIENVTGDATIGEVGSLSIVTDGAGKFTFNGGMSFLTAGDDEVTFGLEDSKVTSISELSAEGNVTGAFEGIQINGTSIAIIEGETADGLLTVFGGDSGITKITGVDADATINNAGGVETLVVNIAVSSGTFNFKDSGEFVIAGDSSVTFALDTAQDAAITGVSELGGMITGALNSLSSVNGKTFQVVNDEKFTVYGTTDASDIAKIAGITGGASIGQVGSVSQVLTDSDGVFKFTNSSWSIAGDTKVTFGLEDSKVIAIDDLEGTVAGGFDGVAVNGSAVQIAGDSSVELVAGASGVTAIYDLSDGATVGAVGGASFAQTEGEGKFTFSNGSFSVAGDTDGVTFVFDGDKVVAVDGLDVGATLTGDLGELDSINGATLDITDADGYGVVGADEGISKVIDLSTPANVVNAGGASQAAVDTADVFTFPNGTFTVSGDSAAVFNLDADSKVVGINVKAGATVTGDLNGLSINGSSAIVVDGDTEFGAVASANGVAQLTGISDGADVVAAGGASQFVTDEEGAFTILGTAMGIADDNSVMFTTGASGITAIDSLEGTATGDFTKGIAVNENEVQVLGDSSIEVTSDGTAVTAIDAVTGSDAPTIVAVGGAVSVGTDSEGQFVFTTSGDSQAFTIEGDDDVTFALEDGVVTGVSELENGTLEFANVENLTVNEAELTIESTANVSLSIADGVINYVTGVTDAISGLENATVAATGALEVNGITVDVKGDSNYKVIVEDSVVTGLADISADATVKVANVTIAADGVGDYTIGENVYNFNDSLDGAFNLTTGDNSELTGVGEFVGEMVIAEPSTQSLTVNDAELEFVSTADSVKVATDGAAITAVDGLESGDAIYGDLGGASIAMPGSTASVASEGSMLTVNDVTYELLNDANGVTVTGGQEVTDLDENASLIVDQTGDYTVNGTALEVEDVTLPIIGLDDATDAYVYDPEHLIIRKGTPVSAIEAMLGLPKYEEAIGTADDPRTKEETDAILGASSTVDLDRPLEIFATNDTKEAQEIDLADTDFSKKVNLFDGEQSVAFNDDGGNEAVVEDGSGAKDITLGDGGDAVIVQADAGDGSQVDITGGSGDDSVVVQGSAPVAFDMSQGGADKVITFASSNARIALTGYNALANPNAGIHITERWPDLAQAIADKLIRFGDGIMSLVSGANNAQIAFGGSLGPVASTFVKLFNYLGQGQMVGFTNSAGGLLDASGSNENLIMIGNSDGSKTGGSTLNGGAGNDTALAGGGDVVDLGEGNNLVQLEDNINRAGAEVVIGKGRTSIENFNGTFNADHADKIATDLTAADISFDGENVYIEGAGFYGVIAGAKPDGAISYDAAELAESADEATSTSTTGSLKTAEGDYTNVLFENGGVDVKTAIAKTGGVMDVKLDFDARALNYVGDESGLTFYGHAGEVLVNLAEGNGSIDTDAALFEGINSVAAGDGQTTIIGGDNNETFFAGTGNDSLYGAGGKNLMVGHDDTGKEGQTSFFVVAENDGAANTIRSFNFVSDNNWDLNTNKITADVLDAQLQYDEIKTEYGAVDVSGDDVVINVTNRNKETSESVVIEGARGKNFIVSGNDVTEDVVAQVNVDQLTADKFADYFVATGKNATLTVSNDLDTANIYLGGRPIGTDQLIDYVDEFYGDIRVIDATGSNAKAELGGNEFDNTILAGTGDTSLWGGDGGNDLLVGGDGKNTFFYNMGNGSDTVENAEDGDVVDLSTLTLDDLQAEITSTGVELKFSDGGSLTVKSTADVAYQVGEETYVVNEDRDGWTKK